MTKNSRQFLGPSTDDFVRLSIGIEDYEDIEADLKQALEKV